MYCSSCGSAVPAGLRYCNHCGAKLSTNPTDAPDSSELFPESLIWAIVSVFVVGIGATIGLMAVMKEVLHFDLGLIMFFSLLSFALMTGIEAVFIWLLLGRSRSGKRQLQAKKRSTNELSEAPPRLLAEPVASVTDQTTRAFEPVYEKRK